MEKFNRKDFILINYSMVHYTRRKYIDSLNIGLPGVIYTNKNGSINLFGFSIAYNNFKDNDSYIHNVMNPSVILIYKGAKKTWIVDDQEVSSAKALKYIRGKS